MATRKKYGRLTSGFKELDKKLAELKTGMNNTIVRKGQREQCRILARAMKSAAPNKVTKRSIGFKVGQNKHERKHVAKVGINVGKKMLSKEAFAKLKRIYASAGEFGIRVGKSGKISIEDIGMKIPSSVGNPIAILFVTGTVARYRHKAASVLGRIRQRLSGRGSTGRMQPHTSFVKKATRQARSEAQNAMWAVIQLELMKIWEKRGSSGGSEFGGWDL